MPCNSSELYTLRGSMECRHSVHLTAESSKIAEDINPLVSPTTQGVSMSAVLPAGAATDPTATEMPWKSHCRSSRAGSIITIGADPTHSRPSQSGAPQRSHFQRRTQCGFDTKDVRIAWDVVAIEDLPYEVYQ